MRNRPRVGFFLANLDQPVTETMPLWHATMPSQPNQAVGSGDAKDFLTYGEYFGAAARFLKRRVGAIASAAATRLRRRVGPEDVAGLKIVLEKHGAFYHPSRVVAAIAGRPLDFVLNVAISKVGQTFLDQEVECLTRLNVQRPYDSLPPVYGQGPVPIDEKRSVKMFLGGWFEGYAEFHVSTPPPFQATRIRVWDPRLKEPNLSHDQAVALYAGVAEILTGYYSVETSEQIFSWHHAAGDFIVKLDRTGLRVKLVTVRRYAPLIEGGDLDAGASVQALLLFLLSTSLRMRIDRMDGVGEMTWLDEYAVEGVLKGFFSGLDRQVHRGFLPDGFGKSFKAYLHAVAPPEIEALFVAIADRLPPHAPERPLVEANLAAHIQVFRHQLKRI